MCLDPATLVSLAIGAAGQAVSGMENAANERRMIEARNAAVDAEMKRQAGFQTKAGDIFSGSLDAFSPEKQAARLAAGKASAGGLFNSSIPTGPMVGTIGFGPAAAGVREAEGERIADAFERSATRAAAHGDLAGWGELDFANRVGLTESGRGLDTVSDLSRNSANVGILEQDVNARNAWRPPSGLGDLLTFAGNFGAFNSGGGRSLFSLPTTSAFRRPAPNFVGTNGMFARV